MKYLSVAEARSQPGLRLVLSAHVPGPWGEAAKAIFRLRSVPFLPVAQFVMQSNDDLERWTGHRNAPIAVLDDEPPRVSWLEILQMAERLGTGPSLLPSDPIERALCIGFCSEICGPEGFGWMRRLERIGTGALNRFEDPEGMAKIAEFYGLREDAIRQAPERLISILSGLSRQIKTQREAGRPWIVGDHLTACDIYWACFSQMVSPLSFEDSPTPDYIRQSYADLPIEIARALDPLLIEHRDETFRKYIGLPLEF